MQTFDEFPGFAACATMVAMTAGIWFIRKRREKEIHMKTLNGTPVDKDPVQRLSSYVLDMVTPKRSLAKSKVENEKGKVSKGQKNLKKRVMVPEKLLIEAHREFELKSLECEQLLQYHSILTEKCHEIMKVLKLKDEVHESNLKNLKDRATQLEEVLFEVVRESELKDKVLEQERQHSRALWSQCEVTSVSLVETKEIADLAIEHCTQVEHEKSILMDQVKTLNDSVEKLKKQLEKTHKNRVNHVKSTLNLENSNLRALVRTLQDSVKNLEEQLDEARRMHGEKVNECEKKNQAYSILKEKYDEMQYVIKLKEDVIKRHKSMLRNLEVKESIREKKLFEAIRESEEKSKVPLAEAKESSLKCSGVRTRTSA